MSKPVLISHYSDVLCVWAYVAQVKLDELRTQFGDGVDIKHHFTPTFGCTEHRIGEGWKDRGGFDGFSDHVVDVCESFPHVEINKAVWKTSRPKSSASTHCFIKAVQLLEEEGVISSQHVEAYDGRTLCEAFVWHVRLAFFVEVKDVSKHDVLFEIAKRLSIPVEAVDERLNNGAAIAALCRDMELKESLNIEGSPTYSLNGGRQKLYGNVGYRILEANVLELMQNENRELASWC
ncbi:DsbA family oxidoreductase [Alkalimarinus alittae]|uniref:DsbA family protein n=1 Tax=Alkalimarinus alittae TaxID=2961619 RepID=A0ABY6N5Z1_9ALTE|nr:DsbA family protein [Alkalimarinus alittae]UZE97543.1 DsbA family protein [Alkalimarinus alittae]